MNESIVRVAVLICPTSRISEIATQFRMGTVTLDQFVRAVLENTEIDAAPPGHVTFEDVKAALAVGLGDPMPPEPTLDELARKIADTWNGWPTLDAEQLMRAWNEHRSFVAMEHPDGASDCWPENCAADIAAEYARLRERTE